MKKQTILIIAGYLFLVLWGFVVFQLTALGQWGFDVAAFLWGNALPMALLIWVLGAFKWIIYPLKGAPYRYVSRVNYVILLAVILPLLLTPTGVADYAIAYQNYLSETTPIGQRLVELQGGFLGTLWYSLLDLLSLAESRYSVLVGIVCLGLVAYVPLWWKVKHPRKGTKANKKEPKKVQPIPMPSKPTQKIRAGETPIATPSHHEAPAFQPYDSFKESAIRKTSDATPSTIAPSSIQGSAYDPFKEPVFTTSAPTSKETPVEEPTWIPQRQKSRTLGEPTPRPAPTPVVTTPITPPPTKVEVPTKAVQQTLELDDDSNEALVMSKVRSSYALPSFDLLNRDQTTDQSINIIEAQDKAQLLNSKFQNLNIRGYVKDYIIAPSFTRFQIVTDQDYRIDQLNTFANDLKMAVSAEKISIQTPIPGTSFSGIDIPNKHRTMVTLRQVLPTIPQQSSPGDFLRVPLGIDIMGNVRHIDIDKSPHLLIAGATGSGKSACINSMLVSLLMRTYPEHVRLVMIDPKRVEMLAFSQVPHLLCPVITDVQKAEVALRKLTEVMDERYTEFGRYAVKNIDSYNRIRTQENKPTMPYIVVFIDELADLILTTRDVETYIQRLTQLARASGIHVVVATQRPSVDVITPVIKSNITSRIAFAVATSHDSRTIFNSGGAEDLLGKGDMLLSFNGEINMSRIQGAFISDDEVYRVTQDLKGKAQPVFHPNFLDLDPPQAIDLRANFDADALNESEDERLYRDIREYIVRAGRVSTSMIQRKYSLGHPRASKMIDRLEEEGIISPLISGNQRQVLVKSIDELED